MDSLSDLPASPAVDATRWLAAGSLLGLILLALVWELVVLPVHSPAWIAIKVLPLCIPLAGILKRKMYTYRWLSLLVWVYFTEGVVRAWSDPRPSATLALAEIALCLTLFAACAYHVRLRLKSKNAS
ncbi:MAG: DUF2069 domain-containing protein [Burkholderiales bacterium]|nr:DUF2069 domain-containing protein [Burkholderiales bacterium]